MKNSLLGHDGYDSQPLSYYIKGKKEMLRYAWQILGNSAIYWRNAPEPCQTGMSGWLIFTQINQLDGADTLIIDSLCALTKGKCLNAQDLAKRKSTYEHFC